MIITATATAETAERQLYLVMCTHSTYPPHAYIVSAAPIGRKTTVDVAAAIARHRYRLACGDDSIEGIATQVTAYADLPEIMFG